MSGLSPIIVENSTSNSTTDIIEASRSRAVLEQLLQTRTCARTDSAEGIVKLLNSIAAIDREYTSKAKFWKAWAIGCGILCVITVVIAFVTEGKSGIAIAPVAVAFLFCLFMCIKRGKLNVHDRRHRIPLELLEFLKTDIPPNLPVEIEIDFRHYKDSREFQTAKKGGMMTSIKQFQYEVPWLTLKGQLYDGSKFRLKITQCTKRKDKQKRKSTKVTETFRDKYNLMVAVKPNRYPGLARFRRLIKTTKTPAALTLSAGQVTGNRVSIQAISTPVKVVSTGRVNRDPLKDNSASNLLHLFVACYHCLGQCRTI